MSDAANHRPMHLSRTARWKAALGVLGCLAFICVGWVLINGTGTARYSASSQHLAGWASILWFGLCGLNGLIALFVPSSLTIESDGFSFKRGWGSTKRYRWDDIDRITVLRQQGVAHVVWTNTKPSGGVKRAMFGFDGSLPGGLTMPPARLARELQIAKERYRLRTT